eukprot:665019-Rhodomonas_salina.2
MVFIVLRTRYAMSAIGLRGTDMGMRLPGDVTVDRLVGLFGYHDMKLSQAKPGTAVGQLRSVLTSVSPLPPYAKPGTAVREARARTVNVRWVLQSACSLLFRNMAQRARV